MKLLHTLISTTALLLAGLSQATPIVVGSMSRDVAGNSPYINDSLNHRQWLGWDVTRGLTPAQFIAKRYVKISQRRTVDGGLSHRHGPL
jgi:hypothetical protein